MLALFTAGALAGGIHVLAGPDHLAAVAPFAIRGRARAWLSGIRWGIGHSVGVGLVALLAWWLREALPLERISGISEQIVGVVLIAIGLWTLRGALKHRVHHHPHEHVGRRHVHMHVHRVQKEHASPGAHEHSHAPLWVGVLHGAAGSSHFLGVLPALALPTRSEAAFYLAGYALGTIGAMTVFAAFLGVITARVSLREGRAYRMIVGMAGCAAIVVGGVWLL